jgi:methylenetetrahydrofolate reductase (NADPH)
MCHLTCVNATREQVRQVAEQARALGIKNLLALRGDPPGGVGDFKPTEGGFEFSHQLVKFLRELGGFSIGTAGFPEGHIACKEGKQVDWQRLKAKIDCGADFVVTQLFFDNDDFFQFRDYLSKLGVTVPICPGVLPILGAGQIKRFSALCGAKLPPKLLVDLERFGDDDAATTEFGIEYASKQCAELIRSGAQGIHFYTLNKAHSTTRIMQDLGLAQSNEVSN